jgi:hypothetical protein
MIFLRPTATEMMALPGILGPKMAFIIESVLAWGNVVSDWDWCRYAYLHRMFNELKWVQPPSTHALMTDPWFWVAARRAVSVSSSSPGDPASDWYPSIK